MGELWVITSNSNRDTYCPCCMSQRCNLMHAEYFQVKVSQNGAYNIVRNGIRLTIAHFLSAFETGDLMWGAHHCDSRFALVPKSVLSCKPCVSGHWVCHSAGYSINCGWIWWIVSWVSMHRIYLDKVCMTTKNILTVYSSDWYSEYSRLTKLKILIQIFQPIFNDGMLKLCLRIYGT